MSQNKTIILQEINNRFAGGSIADTDELADYVDLIYDGWEELRDGFQIFDLASLIGSMGSAWVGQDIAIMQSMDLQDSEIPPLVDRSSKFNLGNSAGEARQFVKWLLVSVQTYDKLIFEKQKRSSE